MPQGCPLSPLAFLLVAEGLTRIVNADPEMKGITVGLKELRLSQFADDTQILANSFESLKRAMRILDAYVR